jgi:uncharacterized protein YigA (DUF484 family)
MTGDDVANYLRAHPEFFDDHAELLAGIEVRHPHEDRAIPLSERQLLQLRERNRVLEGKLRELVTFGEENDSISERLHRITLALMRAGEARELLRLLYFHLREDFAVPSVAVRLWGGPPRDLPEYSPVSAEMKAFAESLGHPYCSHKAMFESADWFGETGPLLRSFAYIKLHDGDCGGILTLASEDPRRFYPDMGTLYLKRLGDVVAASAARWA